MRPAVLPPRGGRASLVALDLETGIASYLCLEILGHYKDELTKLWNKGLIPLLSRSVSYKDDIFCLTRYPRNLDYVTPRALYRIITTMFGNVLVKEPRKYGLARALERLQLMEPRIRECYYVSPTRVQPCYGGSNHILVSRFYIHPPLVVMMP